MFKHIIASIKKNKFISIIFVFQIVISIVGLSQISYYNDYLNIYKKNVKSLGIDADKMYTTKYTGASFKFEVNDGFIKDIQNSLGKDSIGISMDTNLYLESIENINPYNEKLYELNPYLISNYGNNVFNNLKISKSIFNLMDINIIEGRNFVYKDFIDVNNSLMPVLVSEDFKGIFKIGDKIKTSYMDDYIENFEVIGFFDNKLEWFSQDFIHSDLKNLKTTFISIYNYKEDNMHNSNLFRSLYLFSNPNMNDSQFKKSINDIANKNNITIYTKSVEDILNDISNENKNSIISITIIAIILIIFTIFSIGIVSFYSIKNRKSEIGILKIVGASTKKIKIIIISEWIIYMVTSLIISLGIAFNFNKINYEFLKDNVAGVADLANISYLSVLLIWIILFILVLIVVYISISKIINKQVTDLIKGVE